MQAVILGAGDGTRLASKEKIPKILVQVMGLTLLERTLMSLEQMGITEFVLVTGYQANTVKRFVQQRRLDHRYNLRLVYNKDWQLGNARSVLAAREAVGERFVVSMGDHIFDPAGLQGFLKVRGDFVGVFDSSPQYVDVDEATKVDSYRGHVVRLGKQLAEFKYVDVGLFVCSRRLFPILERCIAEGKDEWNDVKRAWIEQGHELLIFDCRGTFWLDIDTPAELRRAEELLRQRLTKPRDGVISRYLNRPLSTRLSARLVRTSITPNQVTVLSFVLAVLAGLVFALGRPLTMVIGGLLAQAASVVDGSDGEIARLKGLSSHYGAWLDAVLDRWADTLILLGMTWGQWWATQRWEVWVLGSAAVAASLILSYSESRYESAFRRPFPAEDRQIPAKRDLRLFLVMLSGLFRQISLALGVIALLGAAEVARRLISQYQPATGFRLPSAVVPEVAEATTPIESRRPGPQRANMD